MSGKFGEKNIAGRTPCGVRGLKLKLRLKTLKISSRTPCGVRGLKQHKRAKSRLHIGRTPCGVRGLKLFCYFIARCKGMSHPVWGAWIETTLEDLAYIVFYVAPRVGCVD